MRVVAFNGSPRKGGNTEIMLQKALDTLQAAGWETELVQVGGKQIAGCRACCKCIERKDGHCVFDNDIFNECLDKIFAADAILMGSPTYFADMTAEMKALLDRSGFVALANGGKLRHKIGAAVVVARRGGSINVFDSINHMFLMNGMVVPGSIYWNLGFGLDKGDVAADEEAMRNMVDLAQNIDWLGKAIQNAS